jgi:hypothetical protein
VSIKEMELQEGQLEWSRAIVQEGLPDRNDGVRRTAGKELW